VFNRLFVRSDALNRQLSAPLAGERRHYLANCAEQGLSHKTLRSKARILISIANHLKSAYHRQEQITTPADFTGRESMGAQKAFLAPQMVGGRIYFRGGRMPELSWPLADSS
jgi:hypothetical protein